MTKILKNQGFKTLDLGILLVLLSLVSVIVLAILSVREEDPIKKRAVINAENLALQLASGGLGQLPSNQDISGRAPASQATTAAGYKASIKLFGQNGRIGLDPWSNPYRYKFIDDDQGPVKVAVWSDGPNKSKDTDAQKLQIYKNGSKFFLVTQGDDLGVAHQIIDTNENP